MTEANWKERNKLLNEMEKLEEENCHDFGKMLRLKREVLKISHVRGKRKREIWEIKNKIRMLSGKKELMSEQEMELEFEKFKKTIK
jgi:hypothetical protein